MAGRLMLLTCLLFLAPDRAAWPDSLKLDDGLYEVEFRLELPHLERYAVNRLARLCFGPGHGRSLIAQVLVLSQDGLFEPCPVTTRFASHNRFAIETACSARGSARALAVYRLVPDGFVGHVAITQGAKNMTMTEVQRGRRLGGCSSPGHGIAQQG